MKRFKTPVRIISTVLATSLVWAGAVSCLYMKNPVGKKVGDAYDIIRKNFVLDYDEDFVKDYTIASMVQALGDRYSAFYPKGYYEKLDRNIQGHYYGIGVVVTVESETNELLITSVQEGAAADRAGIKAGDILVKVGSTEVNGDKLDEAVKLIQVDEKGLGTTVKLTLKRNGEEYKADVVREKIVSKTVESKIIEGDIGYIKVHSFDNETYGEFKEHAEKIKDAKYFILDLRDNGGGTLYSMRNIANMLLPKCTLTTFEYKDGGRTEIKTNGKQKITAPMCVLVNGGSASASELLTAALHDNGRAAVIGEQTYGKAIAQVTIPFEYENGKAVSAMYLTYAKYLTPSGEYIHGKGITPDVTSSLPENYEEGDEDTQLETAIEYLRKEETKKI